MRGWKAELWREGRGRIRDLPAPLTADELLLLPRAVARQQHTHPKREQKLTPLQNPQRCSSLVQMFTPTLDVKPEVWEVKFATSAAVPLKQNFE